LNFHAVDERILVQCFYQKRERSGENMKQFFMSRPILSKSAVVISLLLTGVYAEASSQDQASRNFFDNLLNQFRDRPLAKDMRKSIGGSVERGSSQGTNRLHREHLEKSCLADQGEVQSIYREILLPMEARIRLSSTDGIAKYFDGKGRFGGIFEISSNVQEERSIGSMRKLTWNPEANGGAVKESSDQWVGSLAKYLKGFTSIEDFRIEILSFKAERALRNQDTSMREVRLNVRLETRGISAKDINAKVQDTALANLHVSKTDSGWRIKEWKFLRGETLTGSNPAFKEIALNKTLVPEFERLEAIRRGGFALAISDVNSDGTPDMYIGSHGQGRLLKGLGDGQFGTINNKELESVERVKAAVFADFSGKGRQDLLLIRFATEHADKKSLYRPMDSDLVFFENTGNGELKKREGNAYKYLADYAMPATTADFDNDGLMDLYVGFPGVKDFTTVRGESDVPAAPVKVEGLFLNKSGKLVLQENKILKEKMNYPKQKLYAHSALSVDLNGDSAMDILVIDDRGNLSPAYINDGTGNFVQANKEIGFNNEGFGMGVAAGDIDGDGNLDLAVSNVTFMAQERLAFSCSNNWDYNRPLDSSNKGLRIYRGNGKGKFVEESFPGLEYFGDALGGIDLVDYNGDGLQDIYVVNGLWSGTDRNQEVSYLFDAYLKKRDQNANDSEQFIQFGTVSEMMNALRNFSGDVFDRNSKVNSRPSLGGFQRNRLYRNLGNGRFIEVGFIEGVDSIADGYVVAKADLNGDNAPDLVLRNADPGTSSVSFPPVQVFLNKNTEKNNFLKLVLQGTRSNKDAIGSKVSIQRNKKDQIDFLNGSAGTAQSEKALFFGLGKSEVAETVRITWPSGKSQLLKNIKAGKHQVLEPGLISGR
jgi:hypothetical protein